MTESCKSHNAQASCFCEICHIPLCDECFCDYKSHSFCSQHKNIVENNKSEVLESVCVSSENSEAGVNIYQKQKQLLLKNILSYIHIEYIEKDKQIISKYELIRVL